MIFRGKLLEKKTREAGDENDEEDKRKKGGRTKEARRQEKHNYTDKDRKYAEKVIEHEICARSGNTNKSSPRNDILCDVAQCQVDVAMFQDSELTP